ncbi:hypothetical protein GJW-30_1_02824 [Variibacter gotjawalensis]|uniref:Uncharacterized protein n=1 Tax=Variibacter gotjawalensis TaxID=1333996 RepID=A0A0S3PWX9_9BRAD|nr:hypothetical protein [Variibacter gotjawalensis]RZS48032.1 hypothetical protein EV661_0427 [Variibacter gotjawalensis]BAT60288.1 hypothetical protein GJW-30_1_02824 [Variibacter gotjawalensis]
MRGWLIVIGALILAGLAWWLGIWSLGTTRAPAPPRTETGVPQPAPAPTPPAPSRSAPGSGPPPIPQGRDLGPPRTGDPPPVPTSR